MHIDPGNVQELGIAIASFLTTLITCFLLFNGYRERVARSFGIAFLTLCLWSWFGFFYYLPSSPDISREFRVVSIIGEILFMIFSARFASIYLSDFRPLKRFEKILTSVIMWIGGGFVALTAFDLFGTRIVVGGMAGPASTTLAPHAGPGLTALIIYYACTIMLIGYEVLTRAFNEKKGARRAGIILGTSLVTSLILAGTGFLPWYGLESLTIPRTLALPLFGVAAFYAISNYQLFKLQVAAAEGFVFAIWGFMFFRILFNKNIADAVPDIGLFVALVILGLFLIRSVEKEVRTRLRLQEVSEDLKILNGTLETKVAQRTESLRRASEHIASVVEYLPVGLVEMTQAGVVVRINKTAEGIFGVSENVVGKIIDSVPELKEALAGHQESVFDAAILKPRKRDLQVMRAPLTLEEGKGMVAIIRDVTEERALDRSKSEFVSTAAHQLRTPLTAIKWVFSALSNTKLSKKEQQLNVQQGIAGASNMEHIVEDLLLTARTSEGVLKYQFEPTNVGDVLSPIIADLAHFAERKRVHFTSSIATDLPMVNVDRRMLTFALQNLIDNAIKYTRPDGKVDAALTREGSGVAFRVVDNGIGISSEEQQHIFSKFFRGKEATTLSTDGSGLGLFIVKSIAEAHGGSVSFVSQVGAGTTFTLLLIGAGEKGTTPSQSSSPKV